MTTATNAMHTPGPWAVKQGSDERDFIVAEMTGNTVAEPNCELFNDWPELDPSVRHIGIAEAKANARLIAAAPDLLAALKRLVAYSECSVNDSDIWEEARAAIAKAEGQ